MIPITPDVLTKRAAMVTKMAEKVPLNSTELGFAMVSQSLTTTAEFLREAAREQLTPAQLDALAARVEHAAGLTIELGEKVPGVRR